MTSRPSTSNRILPRDLWLILFVCYVALTAAIAPPERSPKSPARYITPLADTPTHVVRRTVRRPSSDDHRRTIPIVESETPAVVKKRPAVLFSEAILEAALQLKYPVWRNVSSLDKYIRRINCPTSFLPPADTLYAACTTTALVPSANLAIERPTGEDVSAEENKWVTLRGRIQFAPVSKDTVSLPHLVLQMMEMFGFLPAPSFVDCFDRSSLHSIVAMQRKVERKRHTLTTKAPDFAPQWTHLATTSRPNAFEAAFGAILTPFHSLKPATKQRVPKHVSVTSTVLHIVCWSDMVTDMRQTLEKVLQRHDIKRAQDDELRPLDIHLVEIPLDPLTMRPDEEALRAVINQQSRGILFFMLGNPLSGKIHYYHDVLDLAQRRQWRIIADASYMPFGAVIDPLVTNTFDAMIVDWTPSLFLQPSISLSGAEERPVSLFLTERQSAFLPTKEFAKYHLFPNVLKFKGIMHPFYVYLDAMAAPLFGQVKCLPSGPSAYDAIISRRHALTGLLASYLTDDTHFRYRLPSGRRGSPMVRIAGGYDAFYQLPAMALVFYASDGAVMDPRFVDYCLRAFGVGAFFQLVEGSEAIGAVRTANPNTLGWSNGTVMQKPLPSEHGQPGVLVYYSDQPDALGQMQIEWSVEENAFVTAQSRDPPIAPPLINVFKSLPDMTVVDLLHILRVLQRFGTQSIFAMEKDYYTLWRNHHHRQTAA